jgi:hypothetical protein
LEVMHLFFSFSVSVTKPTQICINASQPLACSPVGE